MSATDTSLSCEGLTKRYGAATVLQDVSLHLRPGRIHALMGENGAGKSTLIKLLAGVTPADSMVLRIGTAQIPLDSPQDAQAAGFRFIHQELTIVPQLTVAEDLLLGHALPRRLGFFVDWPALARRAQTALMALGVDHIDARRQAGDLPTGDRMLLKLASALVAGTGPAPRLYVLDEPTAALRDTEAQKLFTVLRGLKTRGAAILYVSHRLEEVVELCDDVTVLRNGRRIRSGPIAKTTQAQIIQDMTGETLGTTIPARTVSISDIPVAEVAGARSARCGPLSFRLNGGEVIGVAGLAGAGQTELLRLFLGLERLRAGRATLLGRPLPRNPASAWARGIAYVPHERRSEGLMLRMGLRSNALVAHLTGLFASRRAETARSLALAHQVALKAKSPEQPVWQLSGGNQQKVVFARALAGGPRLLLLDDPTRGVDVGARAEIYALIRNLSASGCATLIASSDLPELIGLSDRLLLLHEGAQVDLIDASGVTPGDLLSRLYTAGAVKGAA